MIVHLYFCSMLKQGSQFCTLDLLFVDFYMYWENSYRAEQNRSRLYSKIIWRKKLKIFLVGSSQSQCADQSNHREHHHLKETTICFFLPFFPSTISSYASLLHQQQQKPQARCLDKNGPLLRSFEWCMVPVVV